MGVGCTHCIYSVDINHQQGTAHESDYSTGPVRVHCTMYCSLHTGLNTGTVTVDTVLMYVAKLHALPQYACTCTRYNER